MSKSIVVQLEYLIWFVILVGMFDIPPNSLEPMKRQEKELKMFYDSVGRPSDAGTVEEVLQVFDDSSGTVIF